MIITLSQARGVLKTKTRRPKTWKTKTWKRKTCEVRVRVRVRVLVLVFKSYRVLGLRS